MIDKIEIPAFIFKPVMSKETTFTHIKRQDDILDIEFPVFDKEDVLNYASELAMQRRKAHDRSIEDILEVIDLVGKQWNDPNYEYRKEAMRVIPMMTGQSVKMCELELLGSMGYFSRKAGENLLQNEIGGKQYLDHWISRGPIKLHAQPRGVLYHNLAGNTFNVGLISMFVGLLSKNVNIIKLPHEEPYFTVRLAQSIADIDKKIGRELAVLYWKGSRSDIFDELFASGNIDCILCWGGLRSIEEIRQRAYQYGIKVVDHGPKLSFSVISEDILKDPQKMRESAQKIAADTVLWNQMACLSPRVIYLLNKPTPTPERAIESKNDIEICEDVTGSAFKAMETRLKKSSQGSSKLDKDRSDVKSLMQRSAKLLRNEMSDSSPLGFSRILAEEMKNADVSFPREHMTEADGMDMVKKREYFTLKYEISKNGVMITPPNLSWTVMYLRSPPTMNEIEMCYNRFIIVTRLADLEELIQMIRMQKLNRFLQTISIFGSDSFIEHAAEELSLVGAARFPRLGEHNYQDIGAPWDGHYVFQNILRWVYIGQDISGSVAIGKQKM